MSAENPPPVKSFVMPRGTTYLAFGAFVESIVDVTQPDKPKGLTSSTLTGKWNHGAEDTLVVIASPATAREWAGILLEAADAADRDAQQWSEGDAR